MMVFEGIFAALPDPRAGNARHALTDVLVIAFAAVLCGAENCVDMADFGRAKADVLARFLRLQHGAPSHDTFSRVFRLLDPHAFESCFRRFMAGFSAALAGDAGTIVALDGKSIAAACEAGARTTPLHLVSAWAAEQRLVLGQRRAVGRSEVTAALDLVALLDLHNATVTADALHGTRAMAAAVRARGGDYVLALKGNRGPLFRAAVALFDAAAPADSAMTAETAHGRREERSARVLPVPQDWAERFGFQALCGLACIDAVRSSGGREERQRRFFMLSRLDTPARVLHIVRAHWTIENGLHWVLDVVLDEDRSRARRDNAGENLALLRRLALNLLRSDPDKAAIRRKIKRAGWDDDYLQSLIAQMR